MSGKSDLVHSSLASVLASNSGVEAIVNELFVEGSVAGPGHWFTGIPEGVSRRFFDAWEHGADRYEIVTRCQIAATLAGKPRLDFGSGSFKMMTDLIALRNALIHHKTLSPLQAIPEMVGVRHVTR
jgi:hypothetical protein